MFSYSLTECQRRGCPAQVNGDLLYVYGVINCRLWLCNDTGFPIRSGMTEGRRRDEIARLRLQKAKTKTKAAGSSIKNVEDDRRGKAGTTRSFALLTMTDWCVSRAASGGPPHCALSLRECIDRRHSKHLFGDIGHTCKVHGSPPNRKGARPCHGKRCLLCRNAKNLSC